MFFQWQSTNIQRLEGRDAHDSLAVMGIPVLIEGYRSFLSSAANRVHVTFDSRAVECDDGEEAGTSSGKPKKL